MSTNRHFWSDAPACGWATYLWRTVAGRVSAPTVLPPSQALSPYADAVHPRLQLDGIMSEDAEEYSRFIEEHFYSVDSVGTLPIKMRLPKTLLEQRLGDGSWIGVSARTHNRRLVGCVFSKYAGFYERYEAGIVDYLCVAPTHRKTGVADALLRSLYVECMRRTQQRAVQFFRKEGAFKPLPPIWHDLYYGRPILRGLNSYSVEHGVFDRKLWTDYVNHKPAEDILLHDHRNIPSEIRYAFYGAVYVLYKPTYEYGPGEEAGRAILVDWWSLDSHIPLKELEESVLIIMDSLPYNYVYAPSVFPTVKTGYWRVEGTIGMYVFHLDPGVPFKRAVRSAVSW